MRIIFLILISILLLFSKNKIEVKANHISYKNQNKLLLLKGNVEIKEGANFLKAQEVNAVLEDNKIISYEAKDEVEFFYQDVDREYRIIANSVNFDAQTEDYTINGDVIIEDNISSKMEANKVTINQKENKLIIEGNKKPVKLEFEMK